ncbi:MAG TPA: 6,7-dimethyl-8-ribityllumazine synthase [Planctomycetota bacterium]|nr:6,7-dimethyl-8-ribityllumazine synthase [Planctomycetota bacterium]
MTAYDRIAHARFAIVASRFNDTVTDRLVEGALSTFARHGFAREAVDLVQVPGAFELPLACRWLAETGRYAGIVALGAVIRGGTDHYHHVCTAAARGLLDAGLATGVPIAFGVLTCESLADALDRAGGSAGNKGIEAALAALDMALLRATLPR